MAKAADSRMLLSWRNDEESRQNSLTQDMVTEKGHDAWIKKIIGSSENILLIAELDGNPVGAFRMDKCTTAGVGESPDVRLISYAVAPELRRRGLGRAIVAEGCVCYGQEYGLVAKIRDSNVASKKILESCDFQCLGEAQDGILVYLRPSDRSDTIQ